MPQFPLQGRGEVAEAKLEMELTASSLECLMLILKRAPLSKRAPGADSHLVSVLQALP